MACVYSYKQFGLFSSPPEYKPYDKRYKEKDYETVEVQDLKIGDIIRIADSYYKVTKKNKVSSRLYKVYVEDIGFDHDEMDWEWGATLTKKVFR